MKNHSRLISYLLIIISTLLMLTSMASAQPFWSPSDHVPQPTSTQSSITATSTTQATVDPAVELVPYLTGEEDGKLVKLERLSYQISGGDTTYRNSKGIKMAKPLIRWFPKYRTNLEAEVASAKWMGRRSMYAALSAAGYDARQADSLSQAIEKVVNSLKDSRPLIQQIMLSAPNLSRLNALEQRVCSLESRDVGTNNNDLASFRQSILQETRVSVTGLTQAARDSIEAFTEEIRNAIGEQATFDEAVDEQLSLLKGRTWGRIKNKHDITMNVDETPQKTTSDDEEPERSKKKQRKHKAVHMPTPRRL